MTTKKYNELGIDAPLEDPAYDCLDRDIFAKRLLKIIEGTPIFSNIIVGIYGSWGSGKTTTMNFIRWHCEKAGHPVAVYSPWQFHDRKEAWKGFVSSIDKGLAKWEGRIIGSFKRKNLIKKASEKVREITAVTDIGKLCGSLVLAPLEGLLEQTKQRVQEELDKTLKDKRLFIFVDDLDRADPDIVYDILMFLNELVDLNRCIYIVGLDTKVAYLAIKNKIGEIDCKEFLDKIFHWQYELPEPTFFEWQELFEKEIEISGDIKKEALESIFPQLPNNPRKFKHFLRYIAGLHKSFLSRFGDDELDWKILYLTQLLKIEFPEIFKEILADEYLLEQLSSGLLKLSFSKEEENFASKWDEKLTALAEKFNSDKKRLQELCSSIRGHGWIAGPDDLKKYMLIIESPELFTWKEYREFKKKLLQLSQEKLLKELTSFIKEARKSKEIERVREFVRLLIIDRDQLHSQAVEEIDTETGMKPLLAEIKKVMGLCFSLLEVNDVFEGYNPIFNADVFKLWYANLVKWAYFKGKDGKEDIYNEIRELEAKLAYELACKLRHKASFILDILYDVRARSPRGESFEELHKKIREMLMKALAEEVVERFERIDGIKELWGPGHRFERALLFDGSSSFYEEAILEKLKTIAKDASENSVIHKNFYEFTSALFHDALDVDTMIAEKPQKLIAERNEVVDIIWKATISRPMNKRMVGSLEGDRREAIKRGFLNAEQVKPPKWYEELVSDVTD